MDPMDLWPPLWTLRNKKNTKNLVLLREGGPARRDSVRRRGMKKGSHRGSIGVQSGRCQPVRSLRGRSGAAQLLRQAALHVATQLAQQKLLHAAGSCDESDDDDDDDDDEMMMTTMMMK